MHNSDCRFLPALNEQGADIANRYVGFTCLAYGAALWAALCACSQDWHALHCGRKAGQAAQGIRKHLKLSCSARLVQPAFAFNRCRGVLYKKACSTAHIFLLLGPAPWMTKCCYQKQANISALPLHRQVVVRI